MRRFTATLAYSSFAMLGLAGCTRDPTELLVLVNSDYLVPAQMKEVHAVVKGDGGKIASEVTLGLAATGTNPPPGKFVLPITFGVSPANNDDSVSVTIEVSPMESSAEGPRALFTRRAVTGFVKHKILVVPMFLAKQCETTTCPNGQTCTERGCVSENVNKQALTEITKDQASEKNPTNLTTGGRIDAGPAMSADTGLRDSGVVDQGMVDTGAAVDTGMMARHDSGTRRDAAAPDALEIADAAFPDAQPPYDSGFPGPGPQHDAGFPAPPHDAGFPGPQHDAGFPGPGPQPDGGVPPAACHTDTECGGAGMICIDAAMRANCTASSPSCSCTHLCDPFAPSSPECGNRGCKAIGYSSEFRGACLDMTGPVEHDTCSMTFNQSMQAESDTCAPGFFCYAAQMRSPGTCTRACRSGETTCQDISPQLVCTNPYDQTQAGGMCLNPAPAITDIGADCSAGQRCQGFCSQQMLGVCSAGCGNLEACPNNSMCMATPFGDLCVKDCPLGDVDCQSAPHSVCQTRMSWTGHGACMPKCNMFGPGYCPPPTTCDMNTGHCI